MPTNYPNSVVRVLAEKVGEHPSVLDWGAACDGVTDDTTAWQEAVNAISTFGAGYLFIPGTSCLTQVVVPSNVHIYGHLGYSGITTTGAHSSGHGILDLTGTNWSLEGLTIDGKVTTPVGVTYSAISGNPYQALLYDNTSLWVKPGATKGRIHRCRIQHSGGYAVLVDSDTADTDTIAITDNEFFENSPHLFGTNIADLNYGAWTGGIWIRGDCRNSASKPFACKNIKVTGNTFRRCSGEAVWMHSFGFDVHHQNVTINDNIFEDQGLDCIQVGNLFGGQVSDNNIHRAGYITSGAGASTPAYLPGAFCAAIDSTGYAEGVTIEGNTLTSVNGEFIDLDGMRAGSVKGNTCIIPDASNPQYTIDNIAAYGTASANLTKGIQTGNTSINGGGADLSITNNTIVNCSTPAITLAFAKRCLVQGNTIVHPVTAVAPPMEIFALATNGIEWQSYDNKITGNLIDYPAANFCIFEGGDATAYSGTTTNTIFNNHITGPNSGEFLRTSSSASLVGAFFSSNDAGLSAQSLSALTRVGHGTTGALQIYSYSGTGPGYVAQISDVGPGLNVGGLAGKGFVATANRATLGTLNDFGYFGKTGADGFFFIGASTYLDSEANAFSAQEGLLRYIPGTGTLSNTGNLQISTAVTTAGTRIWQSLTFGSATPPGADTQVVFNNAGAFGADSHFTFNISDGQVTISSTNSATAALVIGTGFVQSVGGFLALGSTGLDIQAPAGGVYTKWQTYDNVSFPKANGISTLLSTPNAGYGGFGYKTGSMYWYWNGSAWSTIDFSTAGAAAPGSDKWVIFNDGGSSFGADTGLQYDKTTKILTLSTGYAQAAGGFLTTNTAATAVNALEGGVAALQLYSLRNDGDSGLILDRTSGTARQYGLGVDSSGNFILKDRTAVLNRISISTSGLLSIGSTVQIDQSGNVSASAVFAATGASSGFAVTADTGYNSFQSVAGGGMLARNFTAQAYIQTGTSSGVPVIDSSHSTGDTLGNGAMYYDTSTSRLRAKISGSFVDIATGAATVAGSNTQIQFNDTGAFGASANLTYNKTLQLFTVTGIASTAGILCSTAYIQSDGGFYSTNASSSAVNIPNGGVSALSLISVRNDGASGLSLVRTSGTARTYGLAVDANGIMNFRDDTAGAVRMLMDTSGRFIVAPSYIFDADSSSNRTDFFQLKQVDATMSMQATGSSNYSGLLMLDNNGHEAASFQYANSAASFQPGNFFVAARTASAALLFCSNGLNIHQTIAASGEVVFNSGQITLTPVAAAINTTNGAIWYNSSSQLFQFRQNGSTLSLGAGVLSLNSLTGALNITAGTGVSVTPSGSNISIGIGQAVGTSAAVNFSSVTVSGAFVSSVSGASLGININSNFTVAGNGNILSNGGLNLNGAIQVGSVTVVDSSRNATFATVTSGIYDVTGGFFGQDATGGLICGVHTLFFKGGILYAFT